MRILQIVTRSEPGGGQSIVRSLAEGLLARGHGVTVVSGAEGGGGAWLGMDRRIHHVQVEDLIRAIAPLRDIKALMALSHLYRSSRPDCIHLHTSKAALLGRLAPGVERSRIVYTMHGFDQLFVANRRFLALDRALSGFCGRIVAVNARDRDGMLAAGYPTERVVVVHNGADDPSSLPLPPGSSARILGALRSQGLPLVMTIARDAPPKRLDFVRRLAVRFAGKAIFVWIGGEDIESKGEGPAPDLVDADKASVGSVGSAASAAQSKEPGSPVSAFSAPFTEAVLAAKPWLCGELLALGAVPGAAALLRFADIALLPSDHEGTPVFLLEAMAAGLPCLASAVGGIPELFGTGGGLAVEHEPEAFAAALGFLLDDPLRRQDLGARAREVWREDFSTEGMVAAYEGIYRELAGSRAGRG